MNQLWTFFFWEFTSVVTYQTGLFLAEFKFSEKLVLTYLASYLFDLVRQQISQRLRRSWISIFSMSYLPVSISWKKISLRYKEKVFVQEIYLLLLSTTWTKNNLEKIFFPNLHVRISEIIFQQTFAAWWNKKKLFKSRWSEGLKKLEKCYSQTSCRLLWNYAWSVIWNSEKLFLSRSKFREEMKSLKAI